MRVLVVEDNADLAANVSDFLETCGHTADTALDGLTGLHLAVTHEYDVVVLDLMLPGIDGLTLCQRLRRDGESAVPVLMLTARTALDDKVAGFASGADDYLVKPFALVELELRLRALARRSRGGQGGAILKVGELEMNLDTFGVRRGGRVVVLPATQMKILELLMKRSPNVVWRREIEQSIWGDSPPDSDSLRVHVYLLRSALGGPGAPVMLRTIRGVGYQLVDPDVSPT
ncbi:MAG: response regulator transcription factor [Magnetococcales bacterium]|nr:response regulator transcription factor [Magnetococcales bacterium]MBF0157542.1 response regulator transcription factor [Magnetococcales bacterium]